MSKFKEHRSDLSYKIVSKSSEDGTYKAYARFACAKCCKTTEVHVHNTQRPNYIANSIRASGWKADAYRSSNCLCPECLAGKVPEKPVVEAKKMVGLLSVSDTSKVINRELTYDERLKIRNLLDKHFDDGDGFYLDGMSDHKIADQVNVPAIFVARMREAAYGPIRVDPIVLEIKNKISSLKKDLESKFSDIKNIELNLKKIESDFQKYESKNK